MKQNRAGSQVGEGEGEGEGEREQMRHVGAQGQRVTATTSTRHLRP